MKKQLQRQKVADEEIKYKMKPTTITSSQTLKKKIKWKQKCL